MAAALIGKTEVGLKEYGEDVDTPTTPEAKLMYYFDCMCVVLDMDKTDPTIRRMRNYRRPGQLSQQEVDKLIFLCFLLSPDELANKCIFQDDEMCGYCENNFYELSAVSTRFLISSQVIVGGEAKTVRKIMTFRMCWIKSYWQEPMQHFSQRLVRIITQGPSASSAPRPTPARLEYHPAPAPRPTQQRPAIMAAPSPQYSQPRPAVQQTRTAPRLAPQPTPSPPQQRPSPPKSTGSKCAIM